MVWSRGPSQTTAWFASRLGLAPQEIFRQLIDRSPVGIAVTAGAGHLVEYANDAFCTLSGTPLHEILGQQVHTALRNFGVAKEAIFDRAFVQARRTDVLVDEERRMTDGAIVYARCSVWPLMGPAGDAVGLSVLLEDVTAESVALKSEGRLARLLREINERLVLSSLREREHADEVERQRQQLHSLLAKVSEGVTIGDHSGRVLLMNAAGREILGVDAGAEECSAQARAVEFRRPDGSALAPGERPLERAMRGESFSEYELLVRRGNGSLRRVLFGGTNIVDDAGNTTLAIVVYRDVTRLRDLERSREEYVGLISHDFRAPLGNILLNAGLVRRSLRDRDLSAECDKLERIERNVEYMNTMVDELLEATRLENGGDVGHRERCDVATLVDAVLARMDDANRKRVVFERDGTTSTVVVNGGQMERAISNLVSNALKYSPAGDSVRLALAQRGHEVVLEVIDRGPGIVPAELPLVFERYYRARNSRGVAGLGLGLYITRLLVEANGGRIWAQSEVGRGSTFGIALPRALGEAP